MLCPLITNTQNFSPFVYSQFWLSKLISLLTSLILWLIDQYLSISLHISPPFCQQCQRTIYRYNIYKVTPIWDRNSWCTLRIVARVLSHESCKIWHAERATCTSAESCIMWSAIEKFWSWIKDLQLSICFCIDPIIGRSIFWISMRFSLILASSLRSSSWRTAKYFILEWWEKLEEGSAWMMMHLLAYHCQSYLISP